MRRHTGACDFGKVFVAPGRSAALLIMPLALLLSQCAVAQMSSIGAPLDEIPGLSATGSGNKLYVSAESITETNSRGVAAAADGVSSSPALPAGAPVTLPPPPKRVRDLPELQPTDRVRPFRAAAFGLTASTLGAGAELAVPVARTLNVRFGGSYLNLIYPFNLDGINYAPGLKFTAGQGTLDWFPHHGAFHISAGALYFRNHIAGSASVVAGQSFTLGNTVYTNSIDDPVGGTASVVYGKQIAPLLLLGFGNLLPRSGRHISVPIELGGAYMQAPQLNLNLTGTACTSQGCFNAATNPEIQANLKQEITKLQSDLHLLQVYPVVSIGLACRF